MRRQPRTSLVHIMACRLFSTESLSEPMLECCQLDAWMLRCFDEISIEIWIFSFEKMHLKMSSTNSRPFCLGPNVLKQVSPIIQNKSEGMICFACLCCVVFWCALSPVPVISIHLDGDKMDHIFQTTFSIAIWALIVLYFDQNFTDDCPYSANRQLVVICSVNGLGPHGQQTVTWTNGDPDPWRHMASLGQDEGAWLK